MRMTTPAFDGYIQLGPVALIALLFYVLIYPSPFIRALEKKYWHSLLSVFLLSLPLLIEQTALALNSFIESTPLLLSSFYKLGTLLLFALAFGFILPLFYKKEDTYVLGAPLEWSLSMGLYKTQEPSLNYSELKGPVPFKVLWTLLRTVVNMLLFIPAALAQVLASMLLPFLAIAFGVLGIFESIKLGLFPNAFASPDWLVWLLVLVGLGVSFLFWKYIIYKPLLAPLYKKHSYEERICLRKKALLSFLCAYFLYLFQLLPPMQAAISYAPLPEVLIAFFTGQLSKDLAWLQLLAYYFVYGLPLVAYRAFILGEKPTV